MAKNSKRSQYNIEQKIDPKLRMYSNCEPDINEARSMKNANLFVDQDVKLTAISFTEQNLTDPPPLTKENKRHTRRRNHQIFLPMFLSNSVQQAAHS